MVNQSNMVTPGRPAAFYAVTQGSKLLLSCSYLLGPGLANISIKAQIVNSYGFLGHRDSVTIT